MADPAFNFQEWCRKHRSVLENELRALKSGKIHVYEKRGEQQVDTTGFMISRIEGWLSELSDLLFDT